MNQRIAERLVLHQFPASHFNEKARWALDFKALPHKLVSYVPGSHQLAIRRLSGQTATPVLQADTKVIVGSAAIIEFLERRQPDPALYPAHTTTRSRALELQRGWDVQIGPATRILLFAAAAIELDDAAARLPNADPGLQRRRYRAALAFLAGADAGDEALSHDVYWPNGTDDPARVSTARDIVARGLDWVAATINADGQLVTAGFTVADLTCAALLTPLINVAHPAAAQSVPPPQSVLNLRRQYQDHPAVHWVQAQYQRHRTAPSL